MDILELVGYSAFALAGILLLKVCIYILDFPLLNKWFGLDRAREEVGEELKLSLKNNKDREKINKKIAFRTGGAILYLVIASTLFYIIIFPKLMELYCNM